MRNTKVFLLVVLATILVTCSNDSEPVVETVTEGVPGSLEESAADSEGSGLPPTTDAPATEEGELDQAEIDVQSEDPTPTIEPTPTIPEPTNEPVDEETQERAGQLYRVLVMAQASAELLNETAVRSQEGELEGFDWLGATIVIGAITVAIEDAQVEIDPPESLQSFADDIFELNGMTRDVLARWYDEEIYSEDVILEMEPILFQMEDVISNAEVVMGEEYDGDAAELAQIREELVEELAATLDSAGGIDAAGTTKSQDVANTPSSITVADEFIEISGVGPAVSENFELDSCYKSIFYTTIDGDDWAGVELHSIDEGDYDFVATGNDVKQIELEGGIYFLTTDVEDGVEWSVRGECQSTDDLLAEVPPATDPMPEVFLELDGIGPAVSDNIALGSCYKSVFYTTIDGDDWAGVELHSIDEGDYDFVATGNDVKQIELEGGIYFLTIDVEDGVEWSIRGECGDST